MNKKETTGSPGRIRTNDPAVNSRLLCHWATGEHKKKLYSLNKKFTSVKS